MLDLANADEALILSELKTATADAHARLEAMPRLARLTAPDLDDEAYGEILVRFHAHFATFEPGLLACLACLAGHLPAPALRQRGKTDLLRTDLDDLGLAVAAVEPAPPPACIARAAGWFYVHEGASLGGRLILHAVRRSAALRAARATRFFAGHHGRTAAVWAESRRLIAGLLPDEAALERAVDGAIEAFSAIALRMR